MFSHVRAVLLAVGTLVLVGTIHAVSTATADPQDEVAPVVVTKAATSPQSMRLVEVLSATAVAMRALAIGY